MYMYYVHVYIIHVVMLLMRDEKEERKKQARSNKQTNKAKQHSTPKAVTFPKKNELPQVPCTSEAIFEWYGQLCTKHAKNVGGV